MKMELGRKMEQAAGRGWERRRGIWERKSRCFMEMKAWAWTQKREGERESGRARKKGMLYHITDDIGDASKGMLSFLPMLA